ncbi:DUF3859 domain-containing protein [Vibrio tapetis subsp. quintayensis]|uniref:DUF3859 domain-containing protein n=1 Tax=Vibrio tapetis TaxID=52443 RepID=UPI0025B52EA0|nr:DUF3859 domain-containing protein [Vibrio tapetis]MDN3679239.1 DUF3859 domain-containing protein [Vibrio tapetis subsp. quintayensis]
MVFRTFVTTLIFSLYTAMASANGTILATVPTKSDELPSVTILESGLVTQQGKQYNIDKGKLMHPTVGQYIGFRYELILPKGDEVTKLPITVTMSHPSITDPKTKQKTTTSSWPDTMYPHNKNLAMWYFGEEYEIQSGIWKLEIRFKGNLLASQSFTVANMEQLNSSIKDNFEATERLSQIAAIATEGEKLLCKNPRFSTCMAFDTQQRCEAGMATLRGTCASYAKDKTKQQNPHQTEVVKTFYSHFTVCMASSRMTSAKLNESEVKACFRK